MILSDHGTILPTGNTSQKECSNNLLYRDRIHPVLIEGGTSIFRPIDNVKLQMILQVRTNAFWVDLSSGWPQVLASNFNFEKLLYTLTLLQFQHLSAPCSALCQTFAEFEASVVPKLSVSEQLEISSEPSRVNCPTREDHLLSCVKLCLWLRLQKSIRVDNFDSFDGIVVLDNQVWAQRPIKYSHAVLNRPYESRRCRLSET